MNTKRFVSSVILGGLLMSAVQVPLHAAFSFTDWATYFARRFFVQRELDEKGTEFGTWWTNATDADKVMGIGLGAAAAWFGLNRAFDKDNANRSTNIFRLLFGLFGALGLQQWVTNTMDAGTPEVQRMGINLNQNVDRQERVWGAVSTLHNELFDEPQPQQQQAQNNNVGWFSWARGLLFGGNNAQAQVAPANNAQPNVEPAPAPAPVNQQIGQ